jgi:hypothetical protein
LRLGRATAAGIKDKEVERVMRLQEQQVIKTKPRFLLSHGQLVGRLGELWPSSWTARGGAMAEGHNEEPEHDESH